ncbi:hypothetical protein, partial [Kineococcus auxinigenes]|uniref:hypothetical protein n=1 Tax=Kineococcus sp. SYSU DK014 TaxID=3383135 RepID=UPI003D7DEB76
MRTPTAVRPDERDDPAEPRVPDGSRGSAVARWSLRHRALVVVAWVVLLLAGAGGVARAGPP